MLSTLRVGGIVSGASPAYNVQEMTYALRKADAKFIFTIPDSMSIAAAAAKSAGIPRDRVFLLEGELDDFTTMKQLLEVGKSYGQSGQVPSFKIPKGKRNIDVCAFLSFSSGTTGLPKAVMIAHQNMIAQCLQVQLITPPDLQKILAVLPTFHSKLRYRKSPEKCSKLTSRSHWSCPCPPPPYHHQRGSLHASQIHYERHA